MIQSVQVEIREADGMLVATLLQEGRAASERSELFAPGALTWPATGIGILGEHRGRELAKAFPVRDSEGRITIRTRATREIREAVASGRRFASIEFVALEERKTGAGIREITRAYMDRAALVANPEYTQTSAEIRERRKGAQAALRRQLPWL